MQTNSILQLEWDSQFFGYPIVKVVLDHDGLEKLGSIIHLLQGKRIRLAYIFVPPDLSELNNSVSKIAGAVLIDRKVEYSKPAELHGPISSLISEFSGKKINHSLLSLVLQSGQYSRYKTDPNFINNEYERLYTEWLLKSIDKTLAKKNLIAKIGSNIAGITTVGEKEDSAEIGLVAVDRQHRGKGLGRDLITAADTFAFESGFRKIKVVTQLDNKEACRLYEKCSFSVENVTNIYHLWL
jgi:dTDP-4-amino-4,6-dideoxy-D-galactose acyltransferase